MGLPSILFYRFSFSAVMMGMACLIQKKSFKASVKEFQKTTLLSVFYAATALGLIYCYLYIPSGVATTIHFLYPVLVTLIMTTFFKEKKSIVLFLSAVLSLIGVGFLTWSGESIINPVGIPIVLGIVFTYSIYIVGINKLGVDKMDSQVLTFYILLFTGFILGVFACLTTGIEKITTGFQFINLLLLAFIPTVISNLTLVLAIKYAGSTIASILGSMEPLVAVLIGIFFFNEAFGFFCFTGLLLIIASVILIVLSNQKQKVLRNDTVPIHHEK